MSLAPPGDAATTAVSVAAANARRRRRRERTRRNILGFAGILTAFALWEAVVRVGFLDARFLPPPIQVLPRFVEVMGLSSSGRQSPTHLVGWAAHRPGPRVR